MNSFFSHRSEFGYTIVNPTTSRDNHQEQTAAHSTLAATLNVSGNKQPDVAIEKQIDVQG